MELESAKKSEDEGLVARGGKEPEADPAVKEEREKAGKDA